jgi:ribosome biogenesis ATPase
MNRELLRRRLESSNHRSSTLDEIVDNLRSTYRDYQRIKRQPFTTFVRKTLESLSQNQTNNKKKKNKRKRAEEEDEESESSSGNSSSSTSEDAIYGEKIAPPQFDVTKSNLLAAYMELNGVATAAAAKKNEVEVEKVVVKAGKGEEGPRFRDLGGMDGVLEELKMEVIVPLYHPQLPQWLGVRPMAGILLHGPPGCGKTRLAHAIANETGVPFYKISATEIVSGVSGMYLFFLLIKFLLFLFLVLE